MTGKDDPDCEFLSSQSLSCLNYQQKILFSEVWSDLLAYLRFEGKRPDRNIGYAESNVRPLARRIYQVYEYCWEQDIVAIELTTDVADDFVDALNNDKIESKTGDAYAEGSKRKFVQALSAYFDFLAVDWESNIKFGEEEPKLSSDPFTRAEREQLLNASFDYNSPPSYKNVSAEERDRWNAHLAEYLGSPKEEIGPDDWQELQTSWKYPSLISTALDAGWRAEMVGRLSVDLANLETGQIIIPPDVTVKNNSKWTVQLSNRSVKVLEKWLKQRANKTKYDQSDRIWLNRRGNPYNSKSLNNLLRNLIDDAGIEADGRKLTWHSIRHSTGTYIYNQEKDLEVVAEVLRHKSLQAARKYAHPSPEVKQDIIESIQGGVF
ncbi:MAG: tyrosine-type recombinase/integrase [Candidatus Nanohaloarchaea archaeon]